MNPRLSLFDMLRTRRELTTTAVRHRTIIRILAENPNPSERTRLAISRSIAAIQGTKWQTVYPGVFRDVEKVLIPLELITEEGRLPMKRGPKLLQEQGSPFYTLTQKGLVVTLAIREVEGRGQILQRLAGGQEDIRILEEASSDLTCYMFSRYVKAWRDGHLELTPLDLTKLSSIHDPTLAMYLEFLRSFSGWDSARRTRVMKLLEGIIRTSPEG